MEAGYLMSEEALAELRRFMREPKRTADQTGAPNGMDRSARGEFQAQIQGNAGSVGSFVYSWQEMMEDGSGGFTARTDGMSGTTSTHYATNEVDISPPNTLGPVAAGTIVRMKVTFDASGNPYFRFNLLQLPALASYQGWYANTGGTIVADYLRMS